MDRYQEAALALLQEFHHCREQGNASGFVKRFRQRFALGMQKYAMRWRHVPLKESIADKNPGPDVFHKDKITEVESILRTKGRYRLEHIDQFLKVYMDGRSIDSVSKEYLVSRQALNERLPKMLKLVKDNLNA
jgi:hypothetical protein